jgi:hypothetical protein
VEPPGALVNVIVPEAADKFNGQTAAIKRVNPMVLLWSNRWKIEKCQS